MANKEPGSDCARWIWNCCNTAVLGTTLEGTLASFYLGYKGVVRGWESTITFSVHILIDLSLLKKDDIATRNTRRRSSITNRDPQHPLAQAIYVCT